MVSNVRGSMLHPYMYISAPEGMSEHTCDNVKSSFLPALTADLSHWFTAHVINFRFVPSTSRVYCAAVMVSLVYCGIFT